MSAPSTLRAIFALALLLGLLAFWVDRYYTWAALREQQDDLRAQQAQIIDAQVAGCRRANVIRRNQRIIFDVLRTTAERFAAEDPDQAVRIYLRTQIPVLQAARDRIELVDCEHIFD